MTLLRQRLLEMIWVMLGVLLITFFLVRLIPGDPVELILGEMSTLKEKNALKDQLGLNHGIFKQFQILIGNLSQGDLGTSLMKDKPVSELIMGRIGATFELAFWSMLLTMLISIPSGIYLALNKGKKLAEFFNLFTLAGLSLPGFFLAPLLIYFISIKLNLLPVSSKGSWEYYILPCLSLAIPLSSVLTRIVRASMLEVIHKDYIRTAFSKGLSKNRVYYKHGLKNAMIPILTVIGLQFGVLLTGTVITETIFDWPGLGTLLIEAIQQRDYPIVQGCVLIISVIFIFTNLITDLMYQVFNPQMKVGNQS